MEPGKTLTLYGTPGNALGAYLTDSTIIVHGNVQDATGDTMDRGKIVVHGNSGDTTGYAMRGGEIYIQGNAGYRVGIHMKAYQEHFPVIVIGGKAGDFLGEYQAGELLLFLESDLKTAFQLALFAGPECMAELFLSARKHHLKIFLHRSVA